MIRDDYAGCGGVSEGLVLLGLTDVGYEVMPDAIATRTAAGHATVPCDLSTAPDPTEPLDGYWASPPCQTFSAAGNGDGAKLLPELVAKIHAADWSPAGIDEKTAHVLRVARVCETVDSPWVALEQVPAVLPVWEAIGHRLRARGYSVWAGLLCAADFGVPQTRTRAFLMASRERVAHPPVPTHAREPGASLFGTLRPWVSMADALGWGSVTHHRGAGMVERHGERPPTPGEAPAPTLTGGAQRRWLVERQAHGATRSVDEPAMTITGSADNGNFRWVVDRRTNSRGPGGTQVPTATVPTDRPAPTLAQAEKWLIHPEGWPFTSPATTVAGDPRITARCHHDEGSQGADAKTTEQVRAGDYAGTEPIRLTICEALVLQSFRPDYPVQGSRSSQFLQVGNAVPPLMAAHVVAALTGREVPS